MIMKAMKTMTLLVLSCMIGPSSARLGVSRTLKDSASDGSDATATATTIVSRRYPLPDFQLKSVIILDAENPFDSPNNDEDLLHEHIHHQVRLHLEESFRKYLPSAADAAADTDTDTAMSLSDVTFSSVHLVSDVSSIFLGTDDDHDLSKALLMSSFVNGTVKFDFEVNDASPSSSSLLLPQASDIATQVVLLDALRQSFTREGHVEFASRLQQVKALASVIEKLRIMIGDDIVADGTLIQLSDGTDSGSGSGSKQQKAIFYAAVLLFGVAAILFVMVLRMECKRWALRRTNIQPMADMRGNINGNVNDDAASHDPSQTIIKPGTLSSSASVASASSKNNNNKKKNAKKNNTSKKSKNSKMADMEWSSGRTAATNDSSSRSIKTTPTSSMSQSPPSDALNGKANVTVNPDTTESMDQWMESMTKAITSIPLRSPEPKRRPPTSPSSAAKTKGRSSTGSTGPGSPKKSSPPSSSSTASTTNSPTKKSKKAIPLQKMLSRPAEELKRQGSQLPGISEVHSLAENTEFTEGSKRDKARKYDSPEAQRKRAAALESSPKKKGQMQNTGNGQSMDKLQRSMIQL